MQSGLVAQPVLTSLHSRSMGRVVLSVPCPCRTQTHHHKCLNRSRQNLRGKERQLGERKRKIGGRRPKRDQAFRSSCQTNCRRVLSKVTIPPYTSTKSVGTSVYFR